MIPTIAKVHKSIPTTRCNRDHLYVKAIDSGQGQFLQSVRANIRALWSGSAEWDLSDFINAMRQLISNGYYRAWSEGARECGIALDDMTGEEAFWLRSRILSDSIYADNLGLDIEDGSKANGGKLYSFYPRADLWANNYNEVKNQARLMSCADQKYEWVVTAKESCPSCLKLSGQVRRASFWRESDVHPQHRGKLECMIGAGGIPVCKCYFSKTDARITPGPLPRLP